MRRRFNSIICFFLVCIFLFQSSVPAYAVDQPVYIKEVITSTGKTANEAKKWLTENGYTILDNDLNMGTGEDPVYLGYKTTTKKSEAITDISLMDMDGGYELMDYEEFATHNQTNIKSMTDNLSAACWEMREKLNNGSKAACTALSYLNIFTVPEANEALGDYLLNPERTESDYRMILLVCNSLVINIIYTELSLGCTDYGGENWVERLSSAGPDETLRGADYEEYWLEQYDLYHDDALNLYKVLVSFRNEYLAAEKRKDENNGNVAVPNATEIDAAESIRSFAESGEVTDSCAEDAFVLSVMEYLNGFSYESYMPTEEMDYRVVGVKPEYSNRVMFDGKKAYYTPILSEYDSIAEPELIPMSIFLQQYADCTTLINTRLFTEADTLGDALLEIASADETDDEKISLLYPLVRALTPAQRSLLCVEGLTTFTEITLTDNEALDTLDTKLPEYQSNLLSALESDVASVWIGTNRDIYESKIALTSEARRNAAAANDYEKITYVSEFDTDIKVALCYIGGAAAATAGVTLIALGLGGIVFHGATTAVVAGMMIMGGAISATVSGVAFGCVGVIGIAASLVVVAALVVCAIVYAVDYFIDLYNYYNPDYTDIPSVIIDTTDAGYVTYHAVTDRGTRNADINVWEGKKWNALYYTKNEAAGSPLICVDNVIGFKVVTGSTKAPDGATPVTLFGTKTAVNLNADTYDDDVGGIYLWYFNSINDSNSDFIESTDSDTQTEVLYLESLTLLCHENESAIRDLMKIKGYEILDFNLTSDTEYATFIGYTTTKNPDNAITDIRVSYAGNKGKYYWGDISDTYGLAGSTFQTTEGEQTGLLTSLYYTKSKKRGTPILANLIASKNSTVPENYEPVNLFAGGNAFDFNTYSEESPSDWKNHAYLFFEPQVHYSELNSEAYLGGIAFVSGSTDMSYGKLDSYVKELGMQYCNVNLTNGFTADEDRTWLCYSTTYNPYRAIYDIGVYTAEYRSQSLPENLVLDGVGYISCQTYTQGDKNYYGNIFWGGNYRLIRPNHAYITNVEDYGGDDEYGDTLVCNRGMYVCGPESGKSPIKLSEFSIQNTSIIPDGYIAVHDMTDKYAKGALCLALYDSEHKNRLYITYPGSMPVKHTYISKITVVASTDEDFSYDNAMYQLMASGGDEIIKINLARASSESWKNDSFAAGFNEDLDIEDYEDDVAYIRITRTNVKNDAIGSVAIVMSEKKPESTMKLRYDATENTASFYRAGDKISFCEGKGYYLYYSKTGNKISEFTIDHSPVVSGEVTVLDSNRSLQTNIGYYFHTYSDVSLPYYSMIHIATGDTNLKAIQILLHEGCTEVEKINQSGKPVYIGFAKTSSMLKAVKNVIFDTSSDETLTINEVQYLRHGMVNGLSMYTTIEGVKTKALTEIAFGTSEPFASDYPAGTVFEYVQNASGKKANLKTALGENKDLYMYISHKDNSTFTENAYYASVLTGNLSVKYIAFLFGLLVMAGGTALYFKKKKRKEKNNIRVQS